MLPDEMRQLPIKTVGLFAEHSAIRFLRFGVKLDSAVFSPIGLKGCGGVRV